MDDRKRFGFFSDSTETFGSVKWFDMMKVDANFSCTKNVIYFIAAIFAFISTVDGRTIECQQN